jgi:hypothetical protein
MLPCILLPIRGWIDAYFLFYVTRKNAALNFTISTANAPVNQIPLQICNHNNIVIHPIQRARVHASPNIHQGWFSVLNQRGKLRQDNRVDNGLGLTVESIGSDGIQMISQWNFLLKPFPVIDNKQRNDN